MSDLPELPRAAEQVRIGAGRHPRPGPDPFPAEVYLAVTWSQRQRYSGAGMALQTARSVVNSTANRDPEPLDLLVEGRRLEAEHFGRPLLNPPAAGEC